MVQQQLYLVAEHSQQKQSDYPNDTENKDNTIRAAKHTTGRPTLYPPIEEQTSPVVIHFCSRLDRHKPSWHRNATLTPTPIVNEARTPTLPKRRKAEGESLQRTDPTSYRSDVSTQLCITTIERDANENRRIIIHHAKQFDQFATVNVATIKSIK